jgi:hypothetical protein
MDVTELIIAQLADPLRMGLLVALLFFATNSKGVLNRWLPIALGLAFVAVLIPTAMASDATEPVTAQIGVGFLSNAMIIGVMLFAEAVVEKFRRSK